MTTILLFDYYFKNSNQENVCFKTVFLMCNEKEQHSKETLILTPYIHRYLKFK